MIQVNAIGEACPLPVIKTKKAIEELSGAGVVETLVDNTVAVENLKRMASEHQYGYEVEEKADKTFLVRLTVTTASATSANAGDEACCQPQGKTVVVISSAAMGQGEEELGRLLMKGFIYSLTQLDHTPDTLLFYNSGAQVTCQGSDSLEDLKTLEEKGAQILTCGTCLNFYNLKEKLAVGGVTNMYDIVEKMTQAAHLLRP